MEPISGKHRWKLQTISATGIPIDCLPGQNWIRNTLVSRKVDKVAKIWRHRLYLSVSVNTRRIYLRQRQIYSQYYSSSSINSDKWNILPKYFMKCLWKLTQESRYHFVKSKYNLDSSNWRIAKRTYRSACSRRIDPLELFTVERDYLLIVIVIELIKSSR